MEDSILVQLVLKGHTKYYGEIVNRYSGIVFAKAFGILKSKDMAEEITQETFVKAYTHLDTWKGGGSMAPWLSVMATHLAINMLDKARRQRIRQADNGIETDDYSAEHEALLQRMEKTLSNLKEPDKSIIHLHYYKRNTVKEISHQLQLSTANILVRLHRIRQQLKNQLTTNDYE